MKKRGPTQQRPWQPMQRGSFPPGSAAMYAGHGIDPPDEGWFSDVYSCAVRYARIDGQPQPRSELLWLSIHRKDRKAVRDWRHMQAIKNEVAGPDRVAVEVYPAESDLVDTSNEYHLWVLPASIGRLPFGFDAGLLMDEAEVKRENTAAQQRPWQPGLPTGVTA